jgi:hypothetical protein
MFTLSCLLGRCIEIQLEEQEKSFNRNKGDYAAS